MNCILDVSHPGLFTLIRNLRQEQHTVSGEIVDVKKGNYIYLPPKTVADNGNLNRLIANRGDDPIEFITNVAYNVVI